MEVPKITGLYNDGENICYIPAPVRILVDLDATMRFLSHRNDLKAIYLNPTDWSYSDLQSLYTSIRNHVNKYHKGEFYVYRRSGCVWIEKYSCGI